VLGVNERCDAALLLRFGNGMDGQRGLTRGFRTEDFDDAALGVAAHAKRGVQSDGTSGNDLDVLYFLVAHFHDGAVAKTLFNLVHGGLQGFQFLCVWCLWHSG